MQNEIRLNWDDFFEQEIEIYFKYKYLDASELLEIINNFNGLYQKILNITSPVYVHHDEPMRNFLEVSSVHTGNSITFKFKEGWRPELSFEEGNAYLSIPKKLGVPIIAISLLFGSFQGMTSLYNDYLDAQLKDLEIQIKQIELKEKMETEAFKRRNNRAIKMQANKTVRYFIENENLTHVEINGYAIKGSKDNFNPPGSEQILRKLSF